MNRIEKINNLLCKCKATGRENLKNAALISQNGKNYICSTDGRVAMYVAAPQFIRNYSGGGNKKLSFCDGFFYGNEEIVNYPNVSQILPKNLLEWLTTDGDIEINEEIQPEYIDKDNTTIEDLAATFVAKTILENRGRFTLQFKYARIMAEICFLMEECYIFYYQGMNIIFAEYPTSKIKICFLVMPQTASGMKKYFDFQYKEFAANKTVKTLNQIFPNANAKAILDKTVFTVEKDGYNYIVGEFSSADEIETWRMSLESQAASSAE